ncbi:MAG: hypothetical protein LDL41_07025 [Coleofasciculus sp. S288]|nr:hypothetical protein [Coleofasciculus sp. S288]
MTRYTLAPKVYATKSATPIIADACPDPQLTLERCFWRDRTSGGAIAQ